MNEQFNEKTAIRKAKFLASDGKRCETRPRIFGVWEGRGVGGGANCSGKALGGGGGGCSGKALWVGVGEGGGCTRKALGVWGDGG